MTEPAADIFHPASTNQLIETSVPVSADSSNNNNNLEIPANLPPITAEEATSQNITFELNGEEVSICEWIQIEGQLYFKDSSGNQYLVQDQNLQIDGAQLSSILQDAHDKTNPDSVVENQAGVGNVVDAVNQLNYQKVEPLNSKDTNSTVVKTSSAAIGILPAVDNVNHTIVNNAETNSPLLVSGNKGNATIPIENGKSELAESKHSIDNAKSDIPKQQPKKSLAAQNNQSLKSPTKVAPTNSDSTIKNIASSIMDNFPTKSQLANSPKTYSRPKNIQWITPSIKSNGVDNPEGSSNERKAVLTTTIEIADESDEFFSHDTSDISGEIDNMEIEEQPPLPKLNSGGKINLSPDKSVSSFTPEFKNGLHNDKTDNNNVRQTITLVNVQSKKTANKPVNIEPIKPAAFDINETSSPRRGRRPSIKKDVPEKTLKIKEISPTPLGKRTRSFETKELAEKTPKFTDVKSRKNGGAIGPEINNSILLETKVKDSRDVEFFRDIEQNKNKKKFCIHIRIQPSERNETKERKHACPHCGFESLSYYTWAAHKEACSFYTHSGSSTLNSTRTSRAEIKLEKITFRPFTFKAIKRSEKSFPMITSESEEERAKSDDDDEFSFQGFKKNEVVWAPSNYGMWPALIMDIFPEKRKLSVKFIEYQWKKASLIIDIDSAIHFSEGIERKKWKESNEENLVLKAVSKAEEYNRKKLISTLSEEFIDPKDFFNFSQNPKPYSKTHGIQVEGMKIVDLIKEGECDAHLCSVYEEKISSERHKRFKSENKTTERNCYGPITDEDSQTDLYSHIINLFKSKYGQTTDMSDSDLFSYCYSVWLPEAIIKAITKLYPVGWMNMKVAEEIFNDESVKKTMILSSEGP